MYQYGATLVRVLDGDSVIFDIDLGFDMALIRQNVRLSNVSAPELRSPDPEVRAKAREAMTRLIQLLATQPRGQKYVINTQYKREREKYGRILAEVMLADGTNVNETLIAEGLVERYVP